MFDINIQIKKASALISAMTELLSVKDPLITRYEFKSSHFEGSSGNVLKLLAKAENLQPGTARFIRRDDLIIVEIVDSRKNLVVHSGVLDGGTLHSEEEAKEVLDQYGSLSWSTASFEAITGHLWRLMEKRPNGHEGRWEARALMMAKRVLRALTELRDAGHEALTEGSFRSHLPLDRVITLSLDSRLSEITRKQLSDYLADLPKYEEAKALSGELDESCHIQHGFLVSLIGTALSQLLPPPLLRYEYHIKAPFKKVDAEITSMGVLVTVQYHASAERFALDYQ